MNTTCNLVHRSVVTFCRRIQPDHRLTEDVAFYMRYLNYLENKLEKYFTTTGQLQKCVTFAEIFANN